VAILPGGVESEAETSNTTALGSWLKQSVVIVVCVIVDGRGDSFQPTVTPHTLTAPEQVRAAQKWSCADCS
jgi:hypothetical protein